MNRSKINDLRMWKKWKTAGAIGRIEDAIAKSLAERDELEIKGIGMHYAGPAAGKSTLSLGERVVNEGGDWRVTEPVLAIVASGHNYKLGDKLSKLPRGYQTVQEVFYKCN